MERGTISPVGVTVPASQGTPAAPYGSRGLADRHGPRLPLYSAEERARRDSTRWTIVQGVLAPIQFLVCLVSIGLIVRALLTGEGEWVANASVVIKTLLLLTIMVTGSIWEKVVFGRWLFAPAFFWEDVVSMGVIALHLLYMAALLGGWWSATELFALALVAYLAYGINAAQFLLKLRAARLGSVGSKAHAPDHGYAGASAA